MKNRSSDGWFSRCQLTTALYFSSLLLQRKKCDTQVCRRFTLSGRKARLSGDQREQCRDWQVTVTWKKQQEHLRNGLKRSTRHCQNTASRPQHRPEQEEVNSLNLSWVTLEKQILISTKYVTSVVVWKDPQIDSRGNFFQRVECN